MAGRSLLWPLALLAVAVGGHPAAACSMPMGYRVPTTLDMAAQADVILVATITGERRAKDMWQSVVMTKPTLLLKGDVLPASVELSGAQLADDERARRYVTPSDPRELRTANPGAMIGACVRFIFSPGMKLVLFLRRDKTGNLTAIRSSFSRDAEDVAGPDALWVKAVREYAAIGVAPKSRWPRLLAARATALRALGDRDSRAIAADMDVERTGKQPAPTD